MDQCERGLKDYRRNLRSWNIYTIDNNEVITIFWFQLT